MSARTLDPLDQVKDLALLEYLARGGGRTFLTHDFYQERRFHDGATRAEVDRCLRRLATAGKIRFQDLGGWVCVEVVREGEA